MRHQFRIPIGDWSGDGHCDCQYFAASASKPIGAVRDAFFAAQEKHPRLCPSEWCEAYEDHNVPDDVLAALNAAGLGIDPDYFDAEAMARVVVWFINQGDESVDVKLEENPPSLTFYGRDAKGRHIDGIGYGLTGT